MIACTDYRRALLSHPHGVDAPLRAHRDACTECTAFAQRAAAFEGRLAQALRLDLAEAAGAAGAAGAPGVHLRVIPSSGSPAEAAGSLAAATGLVPRATEAGAAPRQAPGSGALRRRGVGRSGWLAIAASVTLAIGGVMGLWLSAPRSSLAADVVAHMAGEPQAWRTTDVAVPPMALGRVLADAHLHLTSAAGVVSYASSCEFRGHRVPHLVVQTDQGPVTVMVLEHETASRPVAFDEAGYRGMILPVAGHGSIAVLTRGEPDAGAVERVAARVLAAIVWG